MGKKEYLVEGAKLICIRADSPVELHIPEGHNYDSGGKKKANCMDCQKNKNIPCFGKCSKNTKTGMCEGFMELEEKWITLGVSLNDAKKVNGNEALTMDSILICKKGGVIIPLTSGQDFDSEVDMKAFAKRYLKTMMWAMGEKTYCHIFGGDPVNLNTGNYVYDREDLYIQGNLPLEFKRYYNSMSKWKGSAIAEGWKHNYEIKAEIENNKKQITLMMEDGRELKYRRESDGTYHSLFGDSEEFSGLPDGGFRFRMEEREYYFDENGYLRKITNGKGTVTFQYDGCLLQKAVSDNGDYLFYQYSSGGRLISVTDHTGRKVELNYSYGLLKYVITAAGHSYHYEYNEAGKLKSILTPKGIRAIINEYDGQNRVVKQYMPDGGIIECAYDDKNGKTYLKERNGTITSYQSDEKFRNRKTVYEDGEEEYEYNEQNKIVKQKDRNGNITYIQYDSHGNMTKVTDGMKYSSYLYYDKENRLIKTVLQNGAVIENEYTQDGKLKKIRKPLGNENRIIYNAQGLPIKMEYGEGIETEAEYDAKGNIKSIIHKGIRAEYQYDELNRVTVSTDGNGNETKYTYNEEDDITAVTNAENNRRVYEYDAGGKVTSFTDYDGLRTLREYDSCGRVEKETGKTGKATRLTYDKMGHVTGQIFPDGTKTVFGYNKQGKISRITNPLGHTTFFEYDGNGNRTKIVNAKKEETLFSYDGCNRLKARKDPDGFITEYEYNPIGQMTKQKFSTGTELTREYDIGGNCLRETDLYGNTMEYKYNRIGQLTESNGGPDGWLRYEYDKGLLRRIRYPDGSEESFAYDGAGNISVWKRRNKSEIYYHYDCLNRIKDIYDSRGMIRGFTYDAVGNMISMTDGNGSRNEYKYTPFGDVAEARNPDGSGMKYEYDEVGKLISIYKMNRSASCETAALIRLYSYEYDPAGQITGITDANGARESFQYDELGRVTVKKDKDGYDTVYSYGSMGEQESIVYADGRSVRMSYTPLRLLDEVQDWLGSTKINRDENNRVEEIVDHRGKSVGYRYGKRGECNAVIYPDGCRVSCDYDESMRLRNLSDGKNRISYKYNQAGQLAGKQYSNGTESILEYDAAGRVASLTYKSRDNILEKQQYAYDNAGNRIKAIKERSGIREDSGEFSYVYDTADRLTEVYADRDLLRRYEYDDYGNRIRKWENGEETDYVYDAANRLIRERTLSGQTVAEDREYQYDGRGNIIAVYRNGRMEKRYLFNGANRLEEAEEAGGNRKRYIYNGLGYRVGEEITGRHPGKINYTLDQTRKYHNLLQEETENTTYQYMWDENIAGISDQNDSTFIYTDEAGSPLRFVSDRGNTVKTCIWDEYGNGSSAGAPGAWKECRIGFTGYMQDEVSGTCFAQAREYMPAAGRFMSEDRIGGLPLLPLSFNRYAYCYGNPLIFVDLTGLMPDWLVKLCIEGVQAHVAIEADAILAGLKMEGTVYTEVPIDGGLEKPDKKDKKSVYWTPTGKGRMDILYVEGNKAEVYEIKPNSKFGKIKGAKQIDKYVEVIGKNKALQKRYGYTKVKKGSSLDSHYKNGIVNDPYNELIYYETNTYKKYPGIIFYKRKAKDPDKLKRKIAERGVVLDMVDMKKAANVIAAAGYATVGAACYFAMGVLLVDDVTVVGFLDDPVALGLGALGSVCIGLAVSKLGECVG